MTEAGARLFAAVDIGASSGRVIVGRVSAGPTTAGAVGLDVVHRFANSVTELGAGGHRSLHWDLDRLFAEILAGLKAAGNHAAALGGNIASIGIDTWAVDYGLVDAAGTLRGMPHSYRDDRPGQFGGAYR